MKPRRGAEQTACTLYPWSRFLSATALFLYFVLACYEREESRVGKRGERVERRGRELTLGLALALASVSSGYFFLSLSLFCSSLVMSAKTRTKTRRAMWVEGQRGWSRGDGGAGRASFLYRLPSALDLALALASPRLHFFPSPLSLSLFL
jgi:hypothetical protein